MAKEVVLTPYECAVLEVKSAAQALHRAEVNFNNALPDYFEIANSELTIARQRFDKVLKEVKELQPAEDEAKELLSKRSRIQRILQSRERKTGVITPQGELLLS